MAVHRDGRAGGPRCGRGAACAGTFCCCTCVLWAAAVVFAQLLFACLIPQPAANSPADLHTSPCPDCACYSLVVQGVEDLGAGEILLNCIDNDGVGQGFDIDLVGAVSGG